MKAGSFHLPEASKNCPEIVERWGGGAVEGLVNMKEQETLSAQRKLRAKQVLPWEHPGHGIRYLDGKGLNLTSTSMQDQLQR